jgi:NADH-quinone oxidoreductase subunit L
MEFLMMGISVAAATIGFLGAWYLYYKRTDLPAKMAKAAGGLYTFVLDKYKVDEFYGAAIIQPIILISTNVLWKGVDVAVIDGAVNESAAGAKDISDGLRHMQSGNIRSYAGWVAFGAAVVIAFMVWKGVR